MLLNMGGEEILPPSHFSPHGSNIFMGERSSLEGLQGAAFQNSMKCKGEDMAWENGDPHERKTVEEVNPLCGQRRSLLAQQGSSNKQTML